MDKKKILICGITGQLGSALADSLQNFNDFKVYGTYHKTFPDKTLFKNTFPPSFALDVTNRNEVFCVLHELRPDIVINTTALTHVDQCETDQELAYALNVEGNRNLLEGCDPSAQFVYLSTYYLFDGSRQWYDESDFPRPLNYYGKTKLLAEQESLLKKNSLIIRTSKIFSWGLDQRNFIARLYTSLTIRQISLQAQDQYTNPILAEYLAQAIVSLLQQGKTGIYHVGGREYLSNYEFAVRFAEYFSLNRNLIKAASTEELQQAAVRPKQCGLKIDKILNEKIPLFGIQESFAKLREKIDETSHASGK